MATVGRCSGMNITDPIRVLAQARPDAVAMIRYGGASVSFRTLDRLLDRCARRASAEGLEAGQAVGMMIAGGDEAFGLIVALGLARAGIVTADMSVPARYLSAVLTRSGVTPPSDVRGIPLDASWLRDDGDHAVPAHPGDAALFRIFATSGTTGLPRYCPVSHATMAARVAATGFPITGTPWRTVLVCALGLDGNWAMRTVLATLGGGGTLVFTNQAELMTAVIRHKVTALVTSPNALQTILATIPDGLGPLPALRAVVTGGSQLPAKLWQTASRRLCPVIMTSFGACETSVVATGRVDALASVPLGVGTLEPNVEVQAVDADGQPLPRGKHGLLRIRTPGDIAGYLDDAEATASTFRDGWFYPGDIGTVTPEGVLVVAGRTGEFINSGGVKISPRLIEDVLLSLPDVTQAVAFGVPDASGLAQIWAAIVADTAMDTAVLNRLCGEKLGAAAPKFIVQLKELPRNPNGKVLTRALVEAASGFNRAPGMAAGWEG